MADFTRGWLEELGVAPETVDKIVKRHALVLNEVKDDRDKYKADSEKLEEVQKQLDETKKDDFKKKYTEEHAAFESYKGKITAEKEQEQVKAKYTELLKECKVPEKRIPVIMRATDFSEMKLDEKGELVEKSKHSETVKTDWADFIPKTKTDPADESDPRENGGSSDGEDLGELSMEEYIAARNKE